MVSIGIGERLQKDKIRRNLDTIFSVLDEKKSVLRVEKKLFLKKEKTISYKSKKKWPQGWFGVLILQLVACLSHV